MTMKPCPACGPLHDLDCVTCTRCGHTEALPERSPAVQAAMDEVRLSLAEYSHVSTPLSRTARALLAALDGEGK